MNWGDAFGAIRTLRPSSFPLVLGNNPQQLLPNLSTEHGTGVIKLASALVKANHKRVRESPQTNKQTKSIQIRNLKHQIIIQKRIIRHLKEINSILTEALNLIKTLILELIEECEINIMTFH